MIDRPPAAVNAGMACIVSRANERRSVRALVTQGHRASCDAPSEWLPSRLHLCPVDVRSAWFGSAGGAAGEAPGAR